MIKLKDASKEIGVDNITLYDYAHLKDTPLTVKTVGSYWAFDKEEWEAFKQSDECKNLIKDYKYKQKKKAKRARKEDKEISEELAKPIEVPTIKQKPIDVELLDDDSVFDGIQEDPKEKIIDNNTESRVSSDAEEEWLSNVIQDKLYDKDGNVVYDFTKYPEPSAPKGDEPLYLTDWQIQEIKRCKNILYFAHHYIWVKGGKGIEKFEPREFQSRYLRCFLPGAKKLNIHDLLLVWSRQMGKTTCTGVALLHQSQFCGSSKDYVVVANKLSQAMEIMDRIRFSYEYLPAWLKFGLVEYNKGSIRFANKSKIVCRATSADSTRGLSPVILYADEFAFVPANIQEEFYSAMLPALTATKGRFIISSTPNTPFDLFAKLRAGAEDYNADDGTMLDPAGPGHNGFKELKAIWSDMPGRDEAWAEEQRKKIGSEVMFRREFLCEVAGSDDTLINGIILSQLSDETRNCNPINITNNIKWFKAPRADTDYIVALDPALGNSGDNACIQICTFPKMEVIGEWCSNSTRQEYQAHILIQILSFLVKLVHSDRNVYYTYEANYGEGVRVEFENLGWDNVPGTIVSERNGKRRGLVTSGANKRAGCILMKNYIESRKIKLFSKDLVKELSFFNASEETFKASSGHDDRVMALLMVCRVADRIKFWNDEYIDAIQTDDQSYNEPLNFVIHDGGF